ncbi:MAG: sulfatase [Planctomycetaceae bacterium]|nr:sulfatase [Planctomycetaceae bacterium]
MNILSRREMIRRSGIGFGTAALGSLLADSAAGERKSPMAPQPPHFTPKAKRVIHLFMNGGPSHVDTFDPKPALAKNAGKELPFNLPTERKTGAAFPSPYRFNKFGESGTEVSEIFPHVAQCVDDIAVIRSMHADVPNHEPSLLLMNCGAARLIRPSVGSWLTYGLGTENENLPAFIAMCPGGYPIQESQNWQAGFLPGIYQGTYVDTKHREVEKLIEHIRNPSTSANAQQRQLNLLRELNQAHLNERGADAALEARIESFELAFRMQGEASEAFDISREPESIRKMYGRGTQARQILIARRLLQRGVRYVQVRHGQGQPWDNHDDIEKNHRKLARQCNQAIGALLKDLKQQGMLDDTLVIWGGEFGRTPTVELPKEGANQGKINGRDHNHHGFTMWLAGGGIKGGTVYGSTDDFGFQAVEKRMHVHDLHATMLHLLGFDHEQFTYRYAGRDFRLTDVHGRVIHDILA